MYNLLLGLFLITFQVGCYGAPGPRMNGKQVVKRAVCKEDQLDKNPGCLYWKQSGYCDYEYVKARCQESCGFCDPPPPQPCKANENDKKNGCKSWKNQGLCKKGQYHQFMKENCYVTCGYCIAPPTSPPRATPAPQVDPDACLKAHNEKRALHPGTPMLVWDDTLAQHAKTWADHLASKGTLEHAENTGEGENLYYFGTSGSYVATCDDAVQAWYDEIKDYDYQNPVFSLSTGHFTAVVWKSTTRVGAALVKVVDGGYTKTYVVARYLPQGNMKGRFAENVLPLAS